MSGAAATGSRSGRERRLGFWRALKVVFAAALFTWFAWFVAAVFIWVLGLSVSVSSPLPSRSAAVGWPNPVTSVASGVADVGPALFVAWAVAGLVTVLARGETDGRRPIVWWPLALVVLAGIEIYRPALLAVPFLLIGLTGLEPAAAARLSIAPRRPVRLSGPSIAAATLAVVALAGVSLGFALLGNPLAVTTLTLPEPASHVRPSGQEIIESISFTNLDSPAIHLRGIRFLGSTPSLRVINVGGCVTSHENCSFEFGGNYPRIAGQTLPAGQDGSIMIRYALTRCTDGPVSVPPVALDYTAMNIERSRTITTEAPRALRCTR
jgi:hypothetical protein